MDDAMQELTRRVLVATGQTVPLSEGTFSNRADSRFSQDVMAALFAAGTNTVTPNGDGTYTHTFTPPPAPPLRLTQPVPWTDVPTATPLADMRALGDRVTLTAQGTV